MGTKEKQINFDSPEAAGIKTVTGWVSSTGRFFGDGPGSERQARYEGCTHVKCTRDGCDNYTGRGWLACESCRSVEDRQRFISLPYVEWDGNVPVCLSGGDQYFFDHSEVEDYISDQKGFDEEFPDSIDLLICEPVPLRTVDLEFFADTMHDDWEPSDALEKAIIELNKVIEAEPVQTWLPGKKRTSYTLQED